MASPSPNPPPTNNNNDDELELLSGYQRPVLHWYPGHIAKAERELQEVFLPAVDVVVEVRDARIPKATAHPLVSDWCASKPRIVVLTHADCIPQTAKRDWRKAYDQFGAHAMTSSQSNTKTNKKQVQHQARQAAHERAKYTTTSKKSSHKNNNPNDDTTDPIHSVVFVNAQQGTMMVPLKKAIAQAGRHVQERRQRRGLKPRPLRVGLLGYPNVGKSALLNHLLGRRRAKTANVPGVTRRLQWIRLRTDVDVSVPAASRTNPGTTVGGTPILELLDSPGIIPLQLKECQSDATLLAACHLLGEAAYDNPQVAAYLMQWMLQVHRHNWHHRLAPTWRRAFEGRYKLDPLSPKEIQELRPLSGIGGPNMYEDEDDDSTTTKPSTSSSSPHHEFVRTHVNEDGVPVYIYRRPRTGEDLLHDVADRIFFGKVEDAARRILHDFRKGRLGLICLQRPPQQASDPGQDPVLPELNDAQAQRRHDSYSLYEWEQRQERAVVAQEAAAVLGLELPPAVVAQQQQAQQQQPEDQHTDTHVSQSEDRSIQESGDNQDNQDNNNDNDDVGRGLFDGW